VKKILSTILFFVFLLVPQLISYAQEKQDAKLVKDKHGRLVIEVSEIKMPGPYLGYILPLPGVLQGFVNKDALFIGLSIGVGPYLQNEIIISKAPLTQNPSDIIVTCNDPSTIVLAESQEKLQIPLTIPGPGSSKTTGGLAIGWKEGLLLMVQEQGRRVILKGRLSIPVADPNTKEVIYTIDYDFGQSASIFWDKSSKKFIWSDLKTYQK
jgi:hypothetical protein